MRQWSPVMNSRKREKLEGMSLAFFFVGKCELWLRVKSAWGRIMMRLDEKDIHKRIHSIDFTIVSFLLPVMFHCFRSSHPEIVLSSLDWWVQTDRKIFIKQACVYSYNISSTWLPSQNLLIWSAKRDFRRVYRYGSKSLLSEGYYRKSESGQYQWLLIGTSRRFRCTDRSLFAGNRVLQCIYFLDRILIWLLSTMEIVRV